MRQKTEKRYRSRRERLLRRLGLLAALVLFCVTVGDYGLTPGSGIRASEEVVNLERTQVIRSLGSTGIKGTGLSRAYLCANENGMLFALTRFDWLFGWQDAGFASVDCGRNEEIHSGTYRISKMKRGEDNWRWFVFGRIDTEGGVLLRAETGKMDDKTGELWTVAETVDIPNSQWTYRDGHTYFCQELPRYDRGDGREYREVRLTLMDEEGRVLCQTLADQGGSTSMG